MVVGVAAASVAALNLTLVWLHVEREQRNLQVFTAPVSLLPRGATFLAVKPPPPPGELVLVLQKHGSWLELFRKPKVYRAEVEARRLVQ